MFAGAHKPNFPHLAEIEVAQALRKLVRAGVIDDRRGRAALEDLRDLRCVRYDDTVFLPRIWALRNCLSAYDATYVALAEELKATLLTCDARLSSAVGHQAAIELF
jgi:predicted nucleic acid-binding protein